MHVGFHITSMSMSHPLVFLDIVALILDDLVQNKVGLPLICQPMRGFKMTLWSKSLVIVVVCTNEHCLELTFGIYIIIIMT